MQLCYQDNPIVTRLTGLICQYNLEVSRCQVKISDMQKKKKKKAAMLIVRQKTGKEKLLVDEPGDDREL